MDEPFFTIGHSTRAVDELAGLLLPNEVKRIVDVRTVPRSRTNPQYNRDTLPEALAAHGIGYEHIAALGGLRGHRADIAPEINGWWDNASFHNYADYAMTEPFRAGLAQLIEAGRRERCAIMCAEAVWWRCHRRIIADYLLAADETVLHIMAPGQIEPARLTEAAQRDASGHLVYPPQQQELGL